MVDVRKNPPPEAVRQAAQHVLFVEGEPGSIDQEAMTTFLGDLVGVAPLGPSFHVASAAEALHPFHPTYYFLIDRDHHDDAFVERSWQRFPDPETGNLVVWRRRELENYFLVPEYLRGSGFLSVGEDELRACIRDGCQRRLYLDVANHVIAGCRERLKTRWVEQFRAIEQCATRDAAVRALREHPAFASKREELAACSSPDALGDRFDEHLGELTGGCGRLEFGRGLWLERLRGKEVLPTVVTRCFRVPDATGKLLQGRRQQLELARAQLRRPLAEQPEDLQRLRALIHARVRPAMTPAPA